MVAESKDFRAATGAGSTTGKVGITLIKRRSWVPERAAEIVRDFNPRTELGRTIARLTKFLTTEQAAELIEAITRTVIIESALSLRVFRPLDGIARIPFGQNAIPADFARVYRTEDHGIVSRRVVTTAGVGFLVDAWQNITELENMKYHGIGTGSGAEASSETALVTESTTALNPDSTRATGTLAEGAGANIFRSVGTLTADAAIAAIEHGLFSQAAVPGGVLWDRSLYSVVNLAIGDSLQTTYDMTATAGG